jgi:hypothetical protein
MVGRQSLGKSQLESGSALCLLDTCPRCIKLLRKTIIKVFDHLFFIIVTFLPLLPTAECPENVFQVESAAFALPSDMNEGALRLIYKAFPDENNTSIYTHYGSYSVQHERELLVLTKLLEIFNSGLVLKIKQ